MTTDKQRLKQVLKAVRCCRGDFCTRCPLQEEICDEFRVESETLPAALVDMIEDAMEELIRSK